VEDVIVRRRIVGQSSDEVHAMAGRRDHLIVAQHVIEQRQPDNRSDADNETERGGQTPSGAITGVVETQW
jgi:hypothetical protein